MAEGFVLMVVGMSVVFSFLALLVGATRLSSLFFVRFAHWFPEAPEKTVQVPQKTDDFTAIAVAIAAIKSRLS